MISYAQNHEDVVLARALPTDKGFYIDVGAGSPVIHSVTNHFYGLGWRGVNVEPLEHWHEQLVQARPRDVNLQVGLSDESGVLEFFDVSAEAQEESTFSPEVAETLRARGFAPQARQVAVATLAAVCDEHVDVQVDFLKIDVEGLELQVLQGGAWERFRPSIVVVESTYPGTSRPAGAEVAQFMESVGYSATLFDGLNRFFVADEQGELRGLLSAPANVTDGYEDVAMVELERHLADELVEASRRMQESDARCARAEQHAVELEGALEQAHEQALREATTLGERLELAHSEVVVARREESDARIQFQAAREALDRLLAEGREVATEA
jgi:FkbM family methyltransferase